MRGENTIHPEATTQLEKGLREEENKPHIQNPLNTTRTRCIS